MPNVLRNNRIRAARHGKFEEELVADLTVALFQYGCDEP